MHPGDTHPLIVIGVTLLAVLIFNGFMILRVISQKRNTTSTKAWSDMLKIIKSPWNNSDADYDELANLVQKKEESQSQDSH
ncbi:hypothetical protein KQH54_03155 [bacterium]|nr:hypothetical protein [bacterium]